MHKQKSQLVWNFILIMEFQNLFPRLFTNRLDCQKVLSEKGRFSRRTLILQIKKRNDKNKCTPIGLLRSLMLQTGWTKKVFKKQTFLFLFELIMREFVFSLYKENGNIPMYWATVPECSRHDVLKISQWTSESIHQTQTMLLKMKEEVEL